MTKTRDEKERHWRALVDRFIAAKRAAGAYLGGIVRPMEMLPVDPKKRERNAPDLILPDAHIRWGNDSGFDVNNFEDLSDPGFRVNPPERPVLWGHYREEGRTWTDFQITDPENSDNTLILRTTNEIAFKPDWESYTEKREEQVTFSFNNAYTAEGSPSYLRNRHNELFEPIVLDPFSRVVEIGWPGDDFVLISVQFTPAIGGRTESRMIIPPRDDIYAPGGEMGNTQYPDEPNYMEIPPEKEFMAQWQEGSHVESDVEDLETTEETELLALGYPRDENGNITGEPVKFEPGDPPTKYPGVLSVFDYKLELKGYIKTKKTGVGESPPCFDVKIGDGDHGVVPSETIFESDDVRLRKVWWWYRGNCYYGWGSEIISNDPPDQITHPEFGTFQVPADAELIEREIGEGIFQKHQWRLDTTVIHKFYDSDMCSGGIISRNVAGKIPGIYKAKAIYRKWQNTPQKRYDADPCYYALYMVSVSWINKYFRDYFIATQDRPEIAINGSFPEEDAGEQQGLEEGEGNFGAPSGKIRWVWVRGHARPFAEKMNDMDFRFGPGENPDDFPPGQVDGETGPEPEGATCEEIWNAMFNGQGYLDDADIMQINDGIVNWDTEEVAAPTGSDVMQQIAKFMVIFEEQRLYKFLPEPPPPIPVPED